MAVKERKKEEGREKTKPRTHRADNRKPPSAPTLSWKISYEK